MTVFAVNALFLVPGQVGGTETYLRRTLGVMPGLLKADERIVVFANAENAAVLASDLAGAPCVEIVPTAVRAASRPRRLLCENLRLPRALRRTGASVVWNPGNAAMLRAPCPQVTTIHDMQYRRFPEDFSPAALLAMRLLVPAAVRRSAIVLAVSEFSKGEILRFAPDTAEDAIAVTPEAADPVFAAGDSEGKRRARAAGIVGDAPFLLVVSNSYPHKSLETAVEAFGLLAGAFPHRLVVLGRPRRGEPALRAAIAALPDPSRVIRLEHAALEDLAALYCAADALAFPSRYEGFGLPVLEAMSAGLPVVAARAGSVPEVGGDAALYAPPGDVDAFAGALRRVLSDRALASAMARRGRERAKAFSWEKTAAITLSALRRVAAGAKAR